MLEGGFECIVNPIFHAKSYPYLRIISKSIVIAFSLSLEQRYTYCCKSLHAWAPTIDQFETSFRFIPSNGPSLYVLILKCSFLTSKASRTMDANYVISPQKEIVSHAMLDYETLYHGEAASRSTFYLAHAPLTKIFGPFPCVSSL